MHLGGKTTLKKFISDVKVALQHYQLWPSRRGDELKYEGEMRNNLRQGKGRIYYKNGVVYVGNFHENTRHGHGILELNGVNIFEGEWFSDAIQGEGYIKSMKLMSTNCPILLHSSSYCGSLFNNALHGMGTLFLTSK